MFERSSKTRVLWFVLAPLFWLSTVNAGQNNVTRLEGFEVSRVFENQTSSRQIQSELIEEIRNRIADRYPGSVEGLRAKTEDSRLIDFVSETQKLRITIDLNAMKEVREELGEDVRVSYQGFLSVEEFSEEESVEQLENTPSVNALIAKKHALKEHVAYSNTHDQMSEAVHSDIEPKNNIEVARLQPEIFAYLENYLKIGFQYDAFWLELSRETKGVVTIMLYWQFINYASEDQLVFLDEPVALPRNEHQKRVIRDLIWFVSRVERAFPRALVWDAGLMTAYNERLKFGEKTLLFQSEDKYKPPEGETLLPHFIRGLKVDKNTGMVRYIGVQRDEVMFIPEWSDKDIALLDQLKFFLEKIQLCVKVSIGNESHQFVPIVDQRSIRFAGAQALHFNLSPQEYSGQRVELEFLWSAN